MWSDSEVIHDCLQEKFREATKGTTFGCWVTGAVDNDALSEHIYEFYSSAVLNKNKPQMDPKKHCFMITTLDVHRLSIYTYDWFESISNDLFNGLFRVGNRQEARD